MISKASVFLTLARSASLAACSKEWPLNSSVNEMMVDKKDLKSVPILLAWLQIRKLLVLHIALFYQLQQQIDTMIKVTRMYSYWKFLKNVYSEIRRFYTLRIHKDTHTKDTHTLQLHFNTSNQKCPPNGNQLQTHIHWNTSQLLNNKDRSVHTFMKVHIMKWKFK